MVCGPGSRFSGGFHDQFPPEDEVIVAVCGSDSTVMVISVVAGALPKNCGVVDVTTSPASTLSIVTSSPSCISPPSTLKPEDRLADGTERSALGRSVVLVGARF